MPSARCAVGMECVPFSIGLSIRFLPLISKRTNLSFASVFFISTIKAALKMEG